MAGVGRVTVSERRSTTSATEHLGDQERQLQRLPGVQPRIAGRLVPAVEVLVADLHRAAEALGDVLAGELDVDAAGPGAQRPVHVEEAEHLDRKSTRLNSSHANISYAVFCLKQQKSDLRVDAPCSHCGRPR